MSINFQIFSMLLCGSNCCFVLFSKFFRLKALLKVSFSHVILITMNT